MVGKKKVKRRKPAGLDLGIGSLAAIVGESYEILRLAEEVALEEMWISPTWQGRLYATSGKKLLRSDIRLLRCVVSLSVAEASALKVGARLGLTKSPLSTTIKSMVEGKLLKVKVSPADNRVKILTVTKLGVDVLEHVHRRMATMLSTGLSAAESSNLTRLLTRAWSAQMAADPVFPEDG